MKFQPGQSGNPSGKRLHGLYRTRQCTCEACSQQYTTKKPDSRFCSDRCRTANGAWSFKANQESNRRVFGVTKH